jgi:1-acyl-sn-glycerol-3-phosphate acyltransferase
MTTSEYAEADPIWRKIIEEHAYETPARRGIRPLGSLRPFAAPTFHARACWVIFMLSLAAKRGACSRVRWARTCLEIFKLAEHVGGQYTIEGMDVVEPEGAPVVFVANHMSALETYILGSLILPFKDMTFIVKQSLFDYPVFGAIMKGIDAIPVSRENPRDDLKQIMEQGAANLGRGRSIVVFPQHTRSPAFDVSQFNSVGAKLAARNNAVVVPVALKTDFLVNGKRFKDFGPVFPERKIRVAFGQPIPPDGKGKAAHAATVEFIRTRLQDWGGAIVESGV